MLLTIEKVAVLRTIPIFASIPDYVLASVASIIEEIELQPGETFISMGVYGDYAGALMQRIKWRALGRWRISADR
jgi:hypothetical protein